MSAAVVLPLTSDQRLTVAPGSVLLPAASTGLPKDSVANVSLTVAIDRDLITERTDRLPTSYIAIPLLRS